jgi:hypothetical protein
MHLLDNGDYIEIKEFTPDKWSWQTFDGSTHDPVAEGWSVSQVKAYQAALNCDVSRIVL